MTIKVTHKIDKIFIEKDKAVNVNGSNNANAKMTKIQEQK